MIVNLNKNKLKSKERLLGKLKFSRKSKKKEEKKKRKKKEKKEKKKKE
jgi:hypothetical protein